ncbi:NAD(P)H-quinone oxidoreductase subunit H chloroplastic [Bienertia sinuspersici]
MFTKVITVNGPKQLGNIQVPKRASYIRVIMLELSRITVICYGSVLLWKILRRELIYDIFVAVTERVENVGIIRGEEAKIEVYWDQCYELPKYNGIFIKLIIMSVMMNLIELYARVKAPKGESGIFLIGDQSGDGKSPRSVYQFANSSSVS